MSTNLDGDDVAHEEPTLGSSVRPALKWSFLNTGGIKIVGLASTIILARLLSPHDYGVFAIAFVALNLADAINDAGLQAAITRWPGEIDSVAPTAVTVSITASVVCYVLLFFLAPWICKALNAPETTDMLRVLSLILILNGFDAVSAAVLSRNFRQDRQAVADLVGSCSVLLTILLAYLGYGAWNLISGQLVGNLLSRSSSYGSPRTNIGRDSIAQPFGNCSRRVSRSPARRSSRSASSTSTTSPSGAFSARFLWASISSRSTSRAGR